MIVDIKPSADKALRKLGGKTETRLREVIAEIYPVQNVSEIESDEN